MNDDDHPEPAGRLQLGCFRLGAMRLALPLGALREVAPFARLAALPCRSPLVAGAIDLRGASVPVIDLRRLQSGAGDTAPGTDARLAVVMHHEGRLVGLLADAIDGIVQVPASAWLTIETRGEALPPVLAGGVRRPDRDELVGVLSPGAIAAIDGVPRLVEREARAAPSASADAGGDARRPMRGVLDLVLFECAGRPMAIDAACVQSTLAAPVIEPSALAIGACRGVTMHLGRRLPIVDLAALAGLPAPVPVGSNAAGRAGGHALVVRLPDGPVALHVERVVDVVRVDAGHALAVAPDALPDPALFAGAVAIDAGEPRDGPRAWLRLDGAALARSAVLVPLTQALGGDRRPAAANAGAGDGADAGSGPDMLVYALERDVATPLGQIDEILPWSPAAAEGLGDDGPTPGLLLSRGRSISVRCLVRLHTGRPWRHDGQSAILVVQRDGHRHGYAVPRLRAIERARRVYPRPGLARPGGSTAGSAGDLVLVGEPAAERLLPVLELARQP